MATYNPAAAKKMLTDAGFTYKGSKLLDPKGNPVKLDIHVISGWSDWVASNQIITRNLQAIGIDSNVALEPAWGDWFPNAFATKNPTLLWQVALARLAVRLLLLEPVPERVHPVRAGRERRPATGSTSRTPRRRRCSTSGRARSTSRSSTRSRRSWRRSSSRTCRSSRCSSARAGRRTARSTSTASRRRRTSSPTRSSPRTPTTSCSSPASARAARPGFRPRSPPCRRAGLTPLRPPAYARGADMRWFARRLVFYAFALWVALTINFLLPRLMPGEPDRRPAPAPDPGAALRRTPGIVQTYEALLGGGHNSIWQDYVTYLRPHRALRLRHLDVELPDAGLRGHRPDAPLLDLPRRRRLPARVRHRHGDRDGRRVAPRRRRRQRLRPDVHGARRVPRVLHRAARALLPRAQAALVPDPARLRQRASPRASTGRSSRARSATRSCRSS